MSEKENGSYDVVPESEGDQFNSFESSMYEHEQARRMDQQAKLRAACIENGDDAEKFLNTRFGQYLIGQADLESEQAKEALTDVDPSDIRTISDLQNRIKRSRSLAMWISSAIEQGDSEYNEFVQAQQSGEG